MVTGKGTGKGSKNTTPPRRDPVSVSSQRERKASKERMLQLMLQHHLLMLELGLSTLFRIFFWNIGGF